MRLEDYLSRRLTAVTGESAPKNILLRMWYYLQRFKQATMAKTVRESLKDLERHTELLQNTLADNTPTDRHMNALTDDLLRYVREMQRNVPAAEQEVSQKAEDLKILMNRITELENKK